MAKRLSAIVNESKRNAFVALCELASREKWCWRIGCTTCGCMQFRHSFKKLINGLHPDSPNWLRQRRPRDIIRDFSISEQSILVDIVSNAKIEDIAKIAHYPDWLGYLGLVLLFCEEIESQTRTLSCSLIPQFLNLLPKHSASYKYFKQILDDETAIMEWRQLEALENNICR